MIAGRKLAGLDVVNCAYPTKEETMRRWLIIPMGCLMGLIQACSSNQTSCDPANSNACSGGLVCEQVTGAAPMCLAPVEIAGRVADLATGNGIANALVQATDANGSPVSGGVRSAADGSY